MILGNYLPGSQTQILIRADAAYNGSGVLVPATNALVYGNEGWDGANGNAQKAVIDFRAGNYVYAADNIVHAANGAATEIALAPDTGKTVTYGVVEGNYFDNAAACQVLWGVSHAVVQNNVFDQTAQDAAIFVGNHNSATTDERDISVLNNTAYQNFTGTGAPFTYFLQLYGELTASGSPTPHQLTLENNLYVVTNPASSTDVTKRTYDVYDQAPDLASFAAVSNNLWSGLNYNNGTMQYNDVLVYQVINGVVTPTPETLATWNSQTGGSDFEQVPSPTGGSQKALVSLDGTTGLSNSPTDFTPLSSAGSELDMVGAPPTGYNGFADFYGTVRPSSGITIGAVQVPPPAPSNVQASTNSASITLTWTAAQAGTSFVRTGVAGHTNLTGYNIRRATSANANWSAISPLNTTPVSGTSYVDVPGAGTWYYQVTSVDTGGNESAGVAATGQALATHVVGRDLFYNNSYFDGNNTAINSADDSAIATDKQALLPGQTSSSVNLSGYSRGVNGIMVDLSGLAGTPAASDFTFRVGTSGTPSSWAAAPAPSAVGIRSGAGAGGSARVEITWADAAIVNEWAQVTVKADGATGLAEPDVFYFGNLAGDADASGTVNFNDYVAITRSWNQNVPVTNGADLDKSGYVDNSDVQIWSANNGHSLAALAAPGVVGRDIFYNNSYFDGNDPAANANDDNAIATDKQALLAGGGLASFSNCISYSRGINGIMVDLANAPGTITASDFQFYIGNVTDPRQWTAAPAPSTVLVRPGAGINGSARIELVWADSAITNDWLQVTVLADANTGLSAADVFYFGNLIGESGKGAVNGQFAVTSQDETNARNDPHGFTNPAPITDTCDFNRDALVNADDQLIARYSVGHTLYDLTA